MIILGEWIPRFCCYPLRFKLKSSIECVVPEIRTHANRLACWVGRRKEKEGVSVRESVSESDSESESEKESESVRERDERGRYA